MITRALFLALLSLSASAVRAEDDRPPLFRVGARSVIGSGGYLGRSAYFQFGDTWRARASYSEYRSDSATGTTRTPSLRLAYQGESLSAGVSASVTPRNDFYANRAFGADGAWTFLLDDGEQEAALEEVELGAFWGQTRHSQIVPATPGNPQERDIIINQHDLGLNAAVTAWSATLSVEGSATIYDQDFTQLPAAARRRPRLNDAVTLVNSFPSRSGTVRLDYGAWSAFAPYISFSTTRYEIQPQPLSRTYGGGATMRYKDLGFNVGYELTRQSGSDDSKNLSLEATFRF